MAAAEQFTGELTIATMEKCSAGRPVLVAYLRDPADSHGRSVQHPLFDVKVVKLTPSGMHMVGYQIEACDGTMVEVAQGWWGKYLTEPEPTK
jgi:hypothetical protein